LFVGSWPCGVRRDIVPRGRHSFRYLGVDNFADDSYMVSRRPFGARPGKPLLVQGGIQYHFGG